MTSTLWVIALVVAIGAFFTWANGRAKREQAAFRAEDVIRAIENVLSTSDERHDEFDIFLSGPIDDPHLESIRQQCIAISREYSGVEEGKDIGTAGEAKLRLILEGLAAEASDARH